MNSTDNSTDAVAPSAIAMPFTSQLSAADLREIITASGARAEVESMITSRMSRAPASLNAAPITADAHTHLSALAHAATTRTA